MSLPCKKGHWVQIILSEQLFVAFIENKEVLCFPLLVKIWSCAMYMVINNFCLFMLIQHHFFLCTLSYSKQYIDRLVPSEVDKSVL